VPGLKLGSGTPEQEDVRSTAAAAQREIGESAG